MNRFVILEHDFPELHWDFMLEVGSVLKTWRLPRNPLEHSRNPHSEIIEDHRLVYLDYEGEVSGDRGSVKRIDWGKYRQITKSPTKWELTLKGKTLRGRLTLIPKENEFWDFDFEK